MSIYRKYFRPIVMAFIEILLFFFSIIKKVGDIKLIDAEKFVMKIYNKIYSKFIKVVPYIVLISISLFLSSMLGFSYFMLALGEPVIALMITVVLIVIVVWLYLINNNYISL